jgi:hypothetical protein
MSAPGAPAGPPAIPAMDGTLGALAIGGALLLRSNVRSSDLIRLFCSIRLLLLLRYHMCTAVPLHPTLPQRSSLLQGPGVLVLAR